MTRKEKLRAMEDALEVVDDLRNDAADEGGEALFDLNCAYEAMENALDTLREHSEVALVP